MGLGLVGVVPLVVSQLKTEDEEPTDYRGFSTYCGEFFNYKIYILCMEYGFSEIKMHNYNRIINHFYILTNLCYKLRLLSIRESRSAEQVGT